MISGKHVFLHVAIATGCSVSDRHNSLAWMLEAEIVTMVYVYCYAHRLASACCYTAADLYSMGYENVKALQCNNGTLLLFHRCDRLTGDASDCIEDKRSAVQRACEAR